MCKYKKENSGNINENGYPTPKNKYYAPQSLLQDCFKQRVFLFIPAFHGLQKVETRDHSVWSREIMQCIFQVMKAETNPPWGQEAEHSHS